MLKIFQGITLPQALLVLGLAALFVVAKRFVPDATGQEIATFVGLVLFGLASRSSGGPPGPPSAPTTPPNLPILLLMALGSCAPTLGPSEAAELAAHGAALTRCRAEAHTAADAGGRDAGLAAYGACKRDAGIQ